MTQLKQINIKITPEQYDALTALAGDTPLYAYIREIVVSHLERNGIPRQEIAPRGGNQSSGRPTRQIEKMQGMVGEGVIIWEKYEDRMHYIWVHDNGRRDVLSRQSNIAIREIQKRLGTYVPPKKQLTIILEGS